MIKALSAFLLLASTSIATAERFLPHPSGCPKVRFCGCGAMKHLGLTDKRLWKAANWPRYYHGSTPVAVWPGHVAVIDRMTGSNTAMLYDYNSGGHRSRYHERSLRGARIIGGSYAASTLSRGVQSRIDFY